MTLVPASASPTPQAILTPLRPSRTNCCHVPWWRRTGDALRGPRSALCRPDRLRAGHPGSTARHVVHLANIPRRGAHAGASPSATNVAMNYAVFIRRRTLGWSAWYGRPARPTLGLPFDIPPRYAPIDEAHYPYPTSSTTRCRRWPARQSPSTSPPGPACRSSRCGSPTSSRRTTTRTFPSFWSDPRSRHWNAWGYIDERDAALACRLALDRRGDRRGSGHHRRRGHHHGPAVRGPAGRGVPGVS